MPSEDIEDIIENSDFNNQYGYDGDFNNYGIKIKYRRPKDFPSNIDNYDNHLKSGDQCNYGYPNFLPGKHLIYVRSWGCTHNTSDSEYMMGLLAQSGYQVVDSAEKADLWILNSCTVKTPAEDHFRNEINRAKKMGKKLVVAGCVSQSDYRSTYLKRLSIIGVHQIDKVVQAVEETLKGNVVQYLKYKTLVNGNAGGAPLMMPKIRRNPYIEIIAINTGCLNECTYCKTKHARGKLGSYSPEEIMYRAKSAFEEGVKELWITSEDTGAYGKDIGYDLPNLLWALIDLIPEDCMMRIGMTNPPYILEHLEAMAGILQHPRVYSFLHIPVQSGSDYVLSDMKRQYVIEDFCLIVDFLKIRVPGITIATDLICGFPTETEQDFQETLKLVEKYKFPTLFINQFYPRPGTPAAKMKRLPNSEVKRRSRLASALFNSYEPYRQRIGQQYHILITEETKDKIFYVGHNKFYEQILVYKHENFGTKHQDDETTTLMGKWVHVQIIAYGKHHMVGKRITKKRFEIFEQRKYLPNISGYDLLKSCAIMLIGSYVLYKVYQQL